MKQDNFNSIESAVENYSQSLLRLAFSYMKTTQDAEDIVQDAFIQYIKKSPDFESEQHCKAWLMRVTINLCKNLLKSSHRTKSAELTENLPYIEKEDDWLIEEVLKLPEKYKSVIHLYYYEGYDINEIAKLLGRKPTTIGVQLKRGRELLKEKMGGEYL